LRLSERAALWNTKPESRLLPAWWEWANIRLLTKKKEWTTSQRTMMHKASRYHVVRGAMVAAILVMLGLVGWESFGRLKARTLCDRLLESNIVDVPGIIGEMAPYRRWTDALLQEVQSQATANSDSRKLLHVSLALLPVDPGQVDYLYGRLLEAEAYEITVIREVLRPQKVELSKRLWSILEEERTDLDCRLQAACALASYTPDDPRWEKISDEVAARLVIQNAFVLGLGKWVEAFQPVRIGGE
jgi:hypothetical protein